MRGTLRRWADQIGLIERDGAWSIGLYHSPSPTRLGPAGRDGPAFTRCDVTDVRAQFVADPFLHRVAGRWCLFLEVMNSELSRGQVAVASENDTLMWSRFGPERCPELAPAPNRRFLHPVSLPATEVGHGENEGGAVREDASSSSSGRVDGFKMVGM